MGKALLNTIARMARSFRKTASKPRAEVSLRKLRFQPLEERRMLAAVPVTANFTLSGSTLEFDYAPGAAAPSMTGADGNGNLVVSTGGGALLIGVA